MSEPIRERLNRILERTAELLGQHDDWTVRQAFDVATAEDVLLYGMAGKAATPPIGIIDWAKEQQR